MKEIISAILILGICVTLFAQSPRPKTSGTWPAGYWPRDKSQPIIDKTQTIRLAPELSHLSAGERSAVAKLLEVGKIFQTIYEEQRHHQADEAGADLLRLTRNRGSDPAVQNLAILYRL